MKAEEARELARIAEKSIVTEQGIAVPKIVFISLPTLEQAHSLLKRYGAIRALEEFKGSRRNGAGRARKLRKESTS